MRAVTSSGRFWLPLRRTLSVAIVLYLLVSLLAPTQPTSVQAQAVPTLSTIAFTSNRDQPQQDFVNPPTDIYLMDPDGTNVRRLTVTAGEYNTFPILSPDGKKIVFESTRNNISPGGDATDLFVMNADGSELSALTLGASVGWSPDSKNIVFHASQLGEGVPPVNDQGGATSDSDIFVVNVDDCQKANQLAYADRTKGRCRDTAPGLLKNLTNNGGVTIDGDPDWSPDGKTIVFTSLVTGNNPAIYVINADGTGTRRSLNTNNPNILQGRTPDWSPNGEKIAFVIRDVGGHVGTDFEICVMNADADGTGLVRLTNNTFASFGIPNAMVPLNDVRPMWSPDGLKILFARPWKPDGVRGVPAQQLFVMNADGTGEVRLTDAAPGVFPKQPVHTSFASWGLLMIPPGRPPTVTSTPTRTLTVTTTPTPANTPTMTPTLTATATPTP